MDLITRPVLQPSPDIAASASSAQRFSRKSASNTRGRTPSSSSCTPQPTHSLSKAEHSPAGQLFAHHKGTPEAFLQTLNIRSPYSSRISSSLSPTSTSGIPSFTGFRHRQITTTVPYHSPGTPGRPRNPGTLSRVVVASNSWSSTSGGSSAGGGASKLSITETDKLSADVRERVIKAVENLGGRVTLGDVAAKAGLKVSDADKALNALAADANGFLEVSDEGDVLWVFPNDLRAVLATRSLRVRFAPVVKKVQDVGSYVVRVSFGTALVVSIAVVYTAIAVLLNPRSEENRDRGGGYMRGPSFYFNLSDLFWYWDPYYYERQRMRLQTREMSFFESVFSFVFGDGDPNEGLDEARWKAVGELISRKGGVVAAQELAPFLDIPKDFQENESYMLPVLQRFDGVPQVDDQGNILYKFPSLQRTAQDWSGRPKVLLGDAAVPASISGIPGIFGREERDPDAGGLGGTLFGRAASTASTSSTRSLLFFAKNLWEFSGAPNFKQVLAAGLGVVNLVGVLYLSYIVRDPMIVRQAGSEFVAAVVSFLPWLQAYATAFFVIPALRWLNNQRKNEKIMEENDRREESAALLSRPNASLRRKLLNAREQAEKVVLDQERIIYTTAQDVADQDLESKEWERKFERSKRLEEERR